MGDRGGRCREDDTIAALRGLLSKVACQLHSLDARVTS